MQSSWWSTLRFDKVIVRSGYADQIVFTGGQQAVQFEVVGGPEGTLIININTREPE